MTRSQLFRGEKLRVVEGKALRIGLAIEEKTCEVRRFFMVPGTSMGAVCHTVRGNTLTARIGRFVTVN
jgi:hypothetical protein